MPTKNLTPTIAAGTGWTSPALAINPGDGSAVFPANQVPNNWLRLTGPVPPGFDPADQILGLAVEVNAAGSGVTFVAGGYDFSGFGKGFARLGTTAANLASHTTAAHETWDAVDATFFGATTGAGSSVSVIHDLGTAKGVGWLEYRAGCSGNAVAPQLHYSNDGTTWTAVSWSGSAPGVLTVGSPGTESTFSGAFVGVTARYWRLQILNSNNPRIHQFSLWTGGGPIAEP